MKWISILIWLLFWGAMLFSQGVPSNETFKIGFAAYQQGNYELAVEDFNAAIAADPTRNYFYYNRGMAYKAAGNTQLALADFKHANDLKPTAEAYYQQGTLAYQASNLALAKTNFERAREIRKDLENMNYYLGMIYFKEKAYSKGAECLEDYTANVKSNADAFYFYALCQARLGDTAEAVKSIAYVRLNKGNDPKWLYKMYELYLAVADNQNALNNITMLIESVERKPEYYKERATLLASMGQSVESQEDLVIAKQLREAMASK